MLASCSSVLGASVSQAPRSSGYPSSDGSRFGALRDLIASPSVPLQIVLDDISSSARNVSTLFLAPGTHSIRQPLQITRAHSGLHVIGLPNSKISGGVIVSGWRRATFHPNLLQADVGSILKGVKSWLREPLGWRPSCRARCSDRRPLEAMDDKCVPSYRRRVPRPLADAAPVAASIVGRDAVHSARVAMDREPLHGRERRAAAVALEPNECSGSHEAAVLVQPRPQAVRPGHLACCQDRERWHPLPSPGRGMVPGLGLEASSFTPPPRGARGGPRGRAADLGGPPSC